MYRMKLKGMYVMTLKLSSKEHINMDSVWSSTTFHNVRIKVIETVAGKSEAIKFKELDRMDVAVMKELESLGYEKEKIGESYSFINPDWIKAQDKHYGYDWGGSFEA